MIMNKERARERVYGIESKAAIYLDLSWRGLKDLEENLQTICYYFACNWAERCAHARLIFPTTMPLWTCGGTGEPAVAQDRFPQSHEMIARRFFSAHRFRYSCVRDSNSFPILLPGLEK